MDPRHHNTYLVGALPAKTLQKGVAVDGFAGAGAARAVRDQVDVGRAHDDDVMVLAAGGSAGVLAPPRARDDQGGGDGAAEERGDGARVHLFLLMNKYSTACYPQAQMSP